MQVCQHCHTQNRADATFCNHCGALMSGAVPPATAPTYSTAQHAIHTPTTATGRLSPQTRLHNHYLILQTVGQGGMAAVYQAVDMRSGAIVAVKEMSQDGLSPDELREALESFRVEADMLAKLHHPNLPRVFEFFSENTRHYLVMEYIDGQTLEQRQQSTGGHALPEAEVLGWARQLCDVLGYLHTRRPPIIFRDLKPSNIMLTRAGQIKLIDFGIARVFSANRVRDTQVLGTPGFAPPEQYGKAQTDARADIYALGCTLYQLLTGYDPATTPFNLPPLRSRNPHASPQAQAAIERATRLDRDARYPTVAAFAHDLFSAPAARQRAAPKTTLPHPATTIQGGTATAASAARVASATMAAVVVVQPHDVAFGKLKAGQRGVMSITVSGQNGAPVRGQIVPGSTWLSVDRTRFDGQTTVIQVAAETSKIPTAGPQRSALQISCDNQQVFVPVEIEVIPATRAAAMPAPQATTTAKSHGPRSAKSKTGVRASHKYSAPSPQRSRPLRFLTSLAVSFGFAAWFLTTALSTLATQSSRLPLSAPVAMLALLATVLVASVGALAGSGGKGWVGRRLTVALGAMAGLAAMLAADGQWLLARGLDSLTKTVSIPQAALWMAPLLVSLGAALGADPRYSRWTLRILWFISHRAPVITTLLVIGAGVWLGVAITQGHVYIVPCGMIVGAIVGILCAGPINQTLRRIVPVRP